MSPRPPLSTSLRTMSIGAILAAIAALFVWTAGWLTPMRVSGNSIIDAFQYNSGKIFPATRRAHAKGLCVTGSFKSNGKGMALSSAALFRAGTVAVDGRFSLAGGNPGAPDGRNVFRALGLRFTLPGGEEWRMALDHTPIFLASTPADFQAFQIASKADPKTKKPDPKVMAAFLATHPETKRFMDHMKAAPLPSSFANSTYNSINAFEFTNADGVKVAVRWKFVPEDAFTSLDKGKLEQMPSDFLFDKYLERTQQGPVRWHMIVVLAKPGDRTDNATIAWSDENDSIDVGTLTLMSAVPEQDGACRDYVFDPLILPKGVGGSDDPLLSARSAAYSSSFTRRAQESNLRDDKAHKGSAK